MGFMQVIYRPVEATANPKAGKPTPQIVDKEAIRKKRKEERKRRKKNRG